MARRVASFRFCSLVTLAVTAQSPRRKQPEKLPQKHAWAATSGSVNLAYICNKIAINLYSTELLVEVPHAPIDLDNFRVATTA